MKTSSLRLLPAEAVEPAELSGFVAAVGDALADPLGYLPLLLERHTFSVDAGNPATYAFFVDEHGPAGWAGWLRYGGRPDELVWESSTYLAPRLRGSGVFDVAKCWQAHAAAGIRLMLPGSQFLSSIATSNLRSLAATQKFTRLHGWSTSEVRVTEGWRSRTAHVFAWPAPVAAHRCRASAT